MLQSLVYLSLSLCVCLYLIILALEYDYVFHTQNKLQCKPGDIFFIKESNVSLLKVYLNTPLEWSVFKYQTCGSAIKHSKTPHRCYYIPSGIRLH